jgi:hypothetical protein
MMRNNVLAAGPGGLRVVRQTLTEESMPFQVPQVSKN